VFVSRYLKLLQAILLLAFVFSTSASRAESELFETTLSESGSQTVVPLESNLAASEKTSVTKNLPKSVNAQYDVTKNGQPFARVKEQFKVTGNQYQVNSITKGLGVYALLGERKLSSTGEVNAEGLKPAHFELHQGDNAKKSLLADFDWPKKSLQMTVKGQPKLAALTIGTQDLASFAYQFMFLKAADFKKSITMPVTTGKKLNQYQYKVEGEELLEIDGKPYKTLHLVETDPEKTAAESKQFWLAIEHHYVPVRIMMTEDGATLEQIITELQIE
jgi:hypothetical protein